MNQEDAAEWVFAYGSNLHIEDLRSWLRHYGFAALDLPTLPGGLAR